jgi:hypothetical protein
MSLQNLVGKTLESVKPDRKTVERLLDAAQRNLADAQLAGLSAENAFDLAYKSLMQSALVALLAHGYHRQLTSVPRHHQTAIHTLPLTIGASATQVRLLDGMRRQRNLADYSGETVSTVTAKECLQTARTLLQQVRQWLKANRPELL